jgi:hypothetical protein
MNRKQFIILLALVVVVGTAGLIIHQRGNESWQNAGQTIGQKLLPDFPVNDVAQITIRSGTNELNLARSNDLWRVGQRDGYPADFSLISQLLLKFADLKSAQNQEVEPSQLGLFDLLPPGPATNSGTLVEFKDAAGKTLNSVLLGKHHMNNPPANSQPGGMGDEGFPNGRYVTVGGDTKIIRLVSDPLDSAVANPPAWLNKAFFSVQRPESISVQFPETTNSWQLTRASETNDWQLAGAKPGEKLDSSKISDVTSPFNSPSFNDVMNAGVKPDVSGMTNATTVKIGTFDGFTYGIRIGQKRDDEYPLSVSVAANLPASRVATADEKPADKARLDADFKDRQKKLADKLAAERQLGNWIYLVPSFAVDPILVPRNQLLAEVETETNSPAAK